MDINAMYANELIEKLELKPPIDLYELCKICNIKIVICIICNILISS